MHEQGALWAVVWEMSFFSMQSGIRIVEGWGVLIVIVGSLMAMSAWRDWCNTNLDEFNELSEAIAIRDSIMLMHGVAPTPAPPAPVANEHTATRAVGGRPASSASDSNADIEDSGHRVDEGSLPHVLAILHDRGRVRDPEAQRDVAILDLLGFRGPIHYMLCSMAFIVIASWVLISMGVLVPFKIYSTMWYGFGVMAPRGVLTRIRLACGGLGPSIFVLYASHRVVKYHVRTAFNNPSATQSINFRYALWSEIHVWLTYMWGFVKVVVNVLFDVFFAPFTFGVFLVVICHTYIALGSNNGELTAFDVGAWVGNPTEVSVAQATAMGEVMIRYALRPNMCIAYLHEDWTYAVRSIVFDVVPHMGLHVTDVVLWILGIGLLQTIVFIITSMQSVLKEDVFFYPHVPRQFSVVAMMLQYTLGRRLFQFARKSVVVTVVILLIVRISLKTAAGLRPQMFPFAVAGHDILRLLSDGLLVNSTVLIVDHTVKVSTLFRMFFVTVSKVFGVKDDVVADPNNPDPVPQAERDERNVAFLNLRLWGVFLTFIGALVALCISSLILPRELGVLTYRSAFYYDMSEDTASLPQGVKERRLQVYLMGVWVSVVIVVGLCIGLPYLIGVVRTALTRRRMRRHTIIVPQPPEMHLHNEENEAESNRKGPEAVVSRWARIQSMIPPLSFITNYLRIGIRLVALLLMYAVALPYLGGLWIESCLVVPSYCRSTQCIHMPLGNTWIFGLLYFHVWCRVVTRHDFFERPWGRCLNALLVHPWERMDVALHTFLSLTCEILWQLAIPFVVHMFLPILAPYIPLVEVIHHYRLSHALYTGYGLGKILAMAAYAMAPKFADLVRSHIHDDTFLLGLKLHNFEAVHK
jgi:hypothetical protein